MLIYLIIGYYCCPACGYYAFDGTQCWDCGYHV